MGPLITLGIYAAIAVGGILFINSFLNGYEAKGAAKQLAHDKPIIEACMVDKETAVKANAGLRGDLERLGKERDQQSAAVQRQRDLAESVAKAKDAELARADTRVKGLRQDALSLGAQLVAAGEKRKSCDEALAAVDSNLRPMARDRVRDDAQARIALGLDNPPADKGPRPDSLHIGD